VKKLDKRRREREERGKNYLHIENSSERSKIEVNLPSSCRQKQQCTAKSKV